MRSNQCNNTMNKTILIIDDDDLLRKSLTTGLHKNDFSVLTADSAEQGEQILSKITVDAIVLDRMMGGMDGLTFLKKLRNSGNTTPILMLTAMSGPDNTISGLENGANDYLAKPFQLRELILRLKNPRLFLSCLTATESERTRPPDSPGKSSTLCRASRIDGRRGFPAFVP